MGTLSYVIFDAADPLPNATQIMAGLSGTGAPAIHAGQRSILCGRDAIAQELIDRYGAAVWFDAADAQFGGAQALEGGLVDVLPNRLDRVERVHGVGHMGASWAGGGSAPPTVNGSATHMGAYCVSATFAAADYGSTDVSGYDISRAWPWGDDTYKYIVTQGTRAVIKARIAVSRDLQSGEVVMLRSGGGGGLLPSSYGDLEAGQWYELVADAGSPASSGGYRNALNLYLRGDHSAPLTVYVQEHTIWEYSDSTLTQATTSQQPRLVRASNGMPAIQGDGVDDSLAGKIALPGTSLWSVAVFEMLDVPSVPSTHPIWNMGDSGPANDGHRWVRAHTVRRASSGDPFHYLHSPSAGNSFNKDQLTDMYADITAQVQCVAQRSTASGGSWYMTPGKASGANGPRAIDNVTDRLPFVLMSQANGILYFRGRVLGAIIGTTAISDADLSDLYDLAESYYGVI